MSGIMDEDLIEIKGIMYKIEVKTLPLLVVHELDKWPWVHRGDSKIPPIELTTLMVLTRVVVPDE